MSSSEIPDNNKKEKFNSETSHMHFTSSLFADDTMVLGDQAEMNEEDGGINTMKAVMNRFEETTTPKRSGSPSLPKHLMRYESSEVDSVLPRISNRGRNMRASFGPNAKAN